jgi:ABC-type Zn uptake system ZnuABC Zn-binding protein ZnuA
MMNPKNSMKRLHLLITLPLIVGLLLVSCSITPPSQTTPLKVIAIESFLADITQNIAGTHIHVDTLIPLGLDPHSFELTPQDAVKLSESQMVIINGGGFETWLQTFLQNTSDPLHIVDASAGLISRKPKSGESASDSSATGESDPHYWLNPENVVRYVTNIRDALVAMDPSNNGDYQQNAQTYISQLIELDQWILNAVAQIPAENRILITNHESLGYFADRYGFQIAGAVIPSTSSDAMPTAKQLANLVAVIRTKHVKAIFLETGSNPDLAEQVARETGITIVNTIYTHSLTQQDGPAPTYLDMMKYDVTTIVQVLQ